MDTPWKTFGHEGAKRILQRQLAGSNIPHAYLFSGPSGIGKKALALEFAERILKTQKLAAHPDFAVIDQTEEIAVEQVRDFIERLSLKPFVAAKKVAIINNAELLNLQSGNALLKTLEEPSESTVIILVGDGHRLLPTIRSRCLVVNMQLFTGRQLREFAQSRGLEVSDKLIDLSFGSPTELLALAGDESALKIKREKIARWESLKSLSAPERLLNIGEFGDLENPELSDLLSVWLFGERQNLAQRPETFGTVAALGEALADLRSNMNKKSVLQSLFLKI